MQDSFEFAGARVWVALRELPSSLPQQLEDYYAPPSPRPGSAQILVFVSAIAENGLTIDGKQIDVRSRTKEFPRLMDRKTGETLIDCILKMIVKEEPWLTVREPFADTFSKFVEEPEDEVEEEHPTTPPLGLASGGTRGHS